MVQRIIVWIIKLSPSSKRWFWKFWYNHFARKSGFHAFLFMKHGYDEDGYYLDLLEEDEAGWRVPKTSGWLAKAIEKTSLNHFEERNCSMSEGGTIPFMAMVGVKCPEAQFVITGALGTSSNAHWPNEFLHIPNAKKLTGCITSIINDFN